MHNDTLQPFASFTSAKIPLTGHLGQEYNIETLLGFIWYFAAQTGRFQLRWKQ